MIIPADSFNPTATLAASYVFLRISVMRELHALAAEEVEEARVHLRNSDNPRAAFADVAAELDARRAIEQGTRVALAL